jgi:hypothetical protein
MPSDTFDAGIEAAARVADNHAEPTDTPDEFILGYEAAAKRIAKAIRRLTPTASEATAIGAGEACEHGIRHPWQCHECDDANPPPPGDEVRRLRQVLHEISIEAGNTIPPDGEEAAFAALDRIMRLILPFRLPASPKVASDTAPGEMTREEHRLEDLKQMAAYTGPIVSFDVAEPYYLASCDHCGWVGSSELCGADSFGDDSDVYCPRCQASGADCGKVAALAASPTASDTNTAIPGGWKLVPIEPTKAIIDAMEAVEYPNNHAAFYCDMYEAALAASPKPDTNTPVDPGVEGVGIEAAIATIPPGWSWSIGQMMGLPEERRYRCFLSDHNSTDKIARVHCDHDDVTPVAAILGAVEQVYRLWPETSRALAAKPIAGMDGAEVEVA